VYRCLGSYVTWWLSGCLHVCLAVSLCCLFGLYILQFYRLLVLTLKFI
jgi:hypothetical protein